MEEHKDKDSPELLNFACIIQGEEKHLQEIKEYIGECVDKKVANLINPKYDKKEIYILTENQWKEYQRLKDRDNGLIGYWIG